MKIKNAFVADQFRPFRSAVCGVLLPLVSALGLHATEASATQTSLQFLGEAGSTVNLVFDDVSIYQMMSQYGSLVGTGHLGGSSSNFANQQPSVLNNSWQDSNRSFLSFEVGLGSFNLTSYGSAQTFAVVVSADFQYEVLDATSNAWVTKQDRATGNWIFHQGWHYFNLSTNWIDSFSGIDFTAEGWGGRYFNELKTKSITFEAHYQFGANLMLDRFEVGSGAPCDWTSECGANAYHALSVAAGQAVPVDQFFVEKMTLTSVTPVPEPETYAMMLAGLGLLGLVARRRKQV